MPKISQQLKKQNIQNIYPLSPMQEGMLFYALFDKESPAYFEQMSYRLKGKQSIEKLEKSYDILTHRHDILRTVFNFTKTDQPLQVVLKKAIPDFTYIDLRNHNDAEAYIVKYRLQDREHLFDLSKDVMMRLSVLQLNDNEYEFIWSHHHILMDGWCVSLLLGEFLDIYKALSNDRKPELKPVTPYSTFIQWLGKQDIESARNYWQSYLEDYNTASPVPGKKTTGMDNGIYAGASVLHKFTKEETRALIEIAKQCGVTLNTVIQAVWGIVLARYNNVSDVVFGSVVSGRPASLPGVETIIGLFINTVPVRVNLEPDLSFAELIAVMQRSAIESERYHHFPLSQVQALTPLQNNLFDHIMVFENYPLAEQVKSMDGTTASGEIDMAIERVQVFEQTNYSFNVIVFPDEQLTIKFEYDNRAYTSEVIERMMQGMVQVASRLVAGAGIRVSNISPVSAAEAVKLTVDYNATAAAYPHTAVIHSLFAEQVIETPANIAVVGSDSILTYRELDMSSNRLARHLSAKGVKRGDIIALCLDRSADMITGILAVLKAGGVYLPIDPQYPHDRKQFMISDSGTAFVVTHNDLCRGIEGKHSIIDIGLDAEFIADYSALDIQNVNEPEDIAYIIYTSGTTGNPKGCMVSHRNVIRLMKNARHPFDFSAGDVWIVAHSYCFDFSVWEMYGALLYGGKLVVPAAEEVRNVQLFLGIVSRHKVTVLNQTPGAFYNFMHEALSGDNLDFSHLRYVIFGGDKLEPAYLNEWAAKYPLDQVKLVNMYGITETTVHVTYYEVKERDILLGYCSNIGKPLPETTVYILDSHLNLVPEGVAGELFIGGTGVSAGYLNRPELTAQRFIDNPFRPGEKLYKTGDTGRWLADGEIEYLGRNDDQVKIRGFRIELGEVQAAILSDNAVSEAVVVCRTAPLGGKHLIAYIVGDDSLDMVKLRSHLRDRLPDYMIPSFFVRIAKMPLTSNGKTDKKKLPDPDEMNTMRDRVYEAPANETEAALSVIWQEVLHLDKIGVSDNYFNAGGDSIKAIRLVSRINKQLGASIGVKDVFRLQTIREQALFISSDIAETVASETLREVRNEIDQLKDQLLGNNRPKDLRADVVDIFPMSDIEKGMIYHNLLDQESGIYRDQFYYQVREPEFDTELFNKAVEYLAGKHEILRTSFHVTGFPVPVQAVHSGCDIKGKVNFSDISDRSQALQKEYLQQFLEQDRANSFDLGNPGLWQLSVFRLSGDSYGVVFIFHHAILDGWSVASFISELGNTYRLLSQGYEPDKTSLQSSYKDYVYEQLAIARNEKVKIYWNQMLENHEPSQLPFNRNASMASGQGLVASHHALDAGMVKAINDLAERLDVQVKSVYLAAFVYFLKFTTNSNSNIIGLITNGRPELEDGEKILGCFLNSVPFRFEVLPALTIKNLVHSVNSMLLDLKEYDKLSLHEISLIANKGMKNTVPLFDIIFNFVDFHIFETLTGKVEAQENIIGSFENTNTFFDASVSKSGSINFNTKEGLYSTGELEILIGYFENVLRSFVAAADRPVDHNEVIGAQTYKAVTEQFNDTAAQYPDDKTIHALFGDITARSPHHTALICGDEQLTYSELDALANGIAYSLIERGIKRNSIVAVMADRSPRMIAALLGTLKAGAAYLPVDPLYPAERISYMLSDSGAAALLLDKAFEPGYCQYSPLVLEDILPCTPGPQVGSIPGDPAYIIYTSGTTGAPKGCVVAHYNVVRLLFNSRSPFSFSPNDVWIMAHAFSFDFSVWEMYGALLNGGRLIIPVLDEVRDTSVFHALVKKHSVTVLNQTPAAFYRFIKQELPAVEHNLDTHLRYVIFGGDKLELAYLAEWMQEYPVDKIKLVNMYGITETTVHVTYYEVTPQDITSKTAISIIGSPLPETTVFVLDSERNILPPNVIGEMYVGGTGVSLGYLNRPELTRERFIDNQFAPGTLIYKTGDLGRWRADGTLEYIGRNDQQVKIRGFRIELGEIEKALLDYSLVKEAVVIARKGIDGLNDIVAYITSEEEVSAADINIHLKKRLPDYMVPAYYIRIPRLPLTSNGKVDKKALPEPGSDVMLQSRSYVPPQTAIEVALSEMWKQILGVHEAGLDDNFFELGGHSMRALELIASMQKAFSPDLKFRDIFEHPQLRDLAAKAAGYAPGNDLSIARSPVKEFYKASSAQKRLYILNQGISSGTGYNIFSVYSLEGNFDPAQFEFSFLSLLKRHEILRTHFEMRNGEIVQVVEENIALPVSYYDLSEKPGTATQLIDNFQQPFDLHACPLLRIGIIRQAEGRYLLLFDIHHIITDGVSMNLMMKEFLQVYSGQGLPPMPLQYRDYAEWQQERLLDGKVKHHKDYWLRQLSGKPPVLALPLDYPRPAVQSYEGATLSFTVDEDVLNQLQKVANAGGASLYMTVMAAFHAMLHRYTGQEDIIVGTNIAGRIHPDLAGIAGMFVNTNVIRTRPAPDLRFDDFLQQVKNTVMDAVEHEEYQFDDLVVDLGIAPDFSRNPLFDIMFVFQDSPIAHSFENEMLRIQPYETGSYVSKFDITISIEPGPDSMRLSVQYKTGLFKEDTILRFMKYYQSALRKLSGDSAILLGELEIIPDAESEFMLSLNETQSDFPASKTVDTLIRESASLYPDNIAIREGAESISYSGLDDLADRLCVFLRDELGAVTGARIGILADRSINTIVAMIASMRSGCSFVPIDPAYPVSRINHILSDAGVSILLVNSNHLHLIEGFTGALFALDVQVEALGPVSSKPLIKHNAGDDCYVIFTSGSTGLPKGVRITHLSFNNYLNWASSYYFSGQNQGDFALFSSLSFDLTLTSIFVPLLRGRTVTIFDGEVDRMLETMFNSPGVDSVKLTPSHISILEHLDIRNTAVRTIIAGGEQLTHKQVSILHRIHRDITIFNEYGPTEATIGCTVKKIEHKSRNILIGRPISNTRIYIMRNGNDICPLGVPGEIYIAGECLSPGYLNRPELTNEKFLPDPFRPGSRMYRTGDIGRRLADGDIEFISRNDDQVKIRGFRIEIGEIESQLELYPGIAQAVVCVKQGSDNEPVLAAFVAGDSGLSSAHVSSWLKERLPVYMIPSVIMQIDNVPLTENGKVDKNALPAISAVADTYLPPVSETEIVLVEIWEELLGKKRIGILDNFFALGGHSLKALELISAIRKATGKELSLKQIFDTPTIRELSSLITDIEEKSHTVFEMLEKQPYYIVSAAQRRLFLLDKLTGSGSAYNIFTAFRITGKLDKGKLRDAFRALLNRHEALRTCFEVHGSDVFQVIKDEVSFELEEMDPASTIDELVNAWLEREFDLSHTPLMNAGIVSYAADEYILFLNVHHIISDEISTDVFIRDLCALYSGEKPAPLKVQYKEFSAWQKMQKETGGINAAADYWLKKLGGVLPVLDLPLDFPRPPKQSYAGASLSFDLPANLYPLAKQVAENRGATLYMVLLSAFNVLLHKYSGQQDILVGTPVSGRSHPDFEKVMGMFVNTCVIRSSLAPSKKFSDLLEEIKQDTLDAILYQDYQFDVLVDALKVNRDPSRNPIFDVWFVLETTPSVPGESSAGFTIAPYPVANSTSKFDIILGAHDNGTELKFAFQYCTDLFTEETILQMRDCLITVLGQVLSNSEVMLGSIALANDTYRARTIAESRIRSPYPEMTIGSLFSMQAAATPGNVALMVSGCEYTYRDLDLASNSIAHHLVSAYNIKPGDRVAIMLNKSAELITSLLAIVKCGAAYVPLDPSFPVQRIAFILEDINPRAMISHSDHFEKLVTSGVQVLNIDLEEQLTEGDRSPLPDGAIPSDILYIMYTSGSTGKPKGTMIDHKAVARLVKNTNYVEVHETDRIIQTGALSFDASTFEIWGALLNGAGLVLAPKEILLDLPGLKELIDKTNVTIAFFTTALFNTIVSQHITCFSNLRTILFGGEKVSATHVQEFINVYGRRKLRHVYGPTENTTFSTSYPIEELPEIFTTVPIGRAISNTQCYILDQDGQLLPPGVRGELFLGGDGLSKGYLNRPDLNSIRFIPDPFTPGNFLYRTGDICKMRADGNIEFIGRNDEQVKIRGFRIEPGEIEDALIQHEKIDSASVIVHNDDNGLPYLVAYYVLVEPLSGHEVKNFLKERLPDFMIPAHMVELQTMPLTINGKVDKRALPVPGNESIISVKYVSPRNSTEEELAGIWQRLLGIDKVGISDNFFDIGGNSLKIISLHKYLEDAYPGRVGLADLFEYTTIEKLSAHLQKHEDEKERAPIQSLNL